MSDNDQAGIVEAYLRESLEVAKDDDSRAEPHPLLAYIQDDHARKSVSTIISALDSSPDHPDFDDTQIPNLLANTAGSDTLADALEEQNMSMTSFMKGTDDNSRTYWNISEYIRDQWKSRIDGNGVVKVLVTGDEGAGKTDWMINEGSEIGASVIQSETDKKVIGVGNIDLKPDTTNFDEWLDVNSTPALDEILEENYRKETELIVMLDEGDQLFGGFGQSQVSAREIGDRIKLFRKYNAHILMTSQRQVAPDLRNRMEIRHKPDDTNPERLVIADDVDSEGEPEDIILRGEVPETDVDYETLGIGEWEHKVDEEEDEDDDRVEELEREVKATEEESNRRLWLLYSETDMSYREVGEKVGLSKDQVYNRVKEFRDNNDID